MVVPIGSTILPPASVLKSWPAPNYVDPVRSSNAGPIVCAVVAGLATLCVLLRLWTRIFVLHNLGVDDWLVGFAAIPLVGLTVVMMLLIEKYQFDRHMWDVEPQNIETAYKFAWLLQVFYLFCVNPAKISVLLFYQRLTTHTVNRTFLLVVRGTIAFIILHIISFLLFLILECRPLDSYWTRYQTSNLLAAAIAPTSVKNTCVNEAGAIFGMSVPSVFTDLLTTLLPNLLLHRLNVSRSQKWKLALLFGAGYIVTVVGAVRVVWTWKYSYVSWDRSWTGHTLLLWTSLEASFAVLCTCAPALNALYTRCVGPKVKELASSVRTKRKSQAVVYTGLGQKAPFSGTATTSTTVSTVRDSFAKPFPQKDIEMASVNVYPVDNR